jgi:serine phosphatase RsbU (regulator of sigma subunit)
VQKGAMHILKPARRGIGHNDLNIEFIQEEFQLESGDVLYLSSDGYRDQLGGPNGKRMMRKVTREKLLNLSSEPLDRQREVLISDFEDWKGTGQQTDDICVMGIRV